MARSGSGSYAGIRPPRLAAQGDRVKFSRLAYDQATKHFIEGGVNRVILAADGDFNVGVTDNGELVRLIEDKAKTGVALSGHGSSTWCARRRRSRTH